jgi:hypothetical protein
MLFLYLFVSRACEDYEGIDFQGRDVHMLVVVTSHGDGGMNPSSFPISPAKKYPALPCMPITDANVNLSPDTGYEKRIDQEKKRGR